MSVPNPPETILKESAEINGVWSDVPPLAMISTDTPGFCPVSLARNKAEMIAVSCVPLFAAATPKIS